MVILPLYDSPYTLNNLNHYPLQDHDDSQGLLLHTTLHPHCSHCYSLTTYSDWEHDGEGFVLGYHIALCHHD